MHFYYSILYFAPFLALSHAAPATVDLCYKCLPPGKSTPNNYYITLPDGNSYCNDGFKPCGGVSWWNNPSNSPDFPKHPAPGRCQMMLTQYADGSTDTSAKFGASFLDNNASPLGNTNNTITEHERWTISTAFGPTIIVWYEGGGLTATVWGQNEVTQRTYSSGPGGATLVVGTQYASPGLVNRFYTQFDCGKAK